MEQRESKPYYRPYVWAVVIAGSLAFADSVYHLRAAELGLPFWLLAFSTILIASRIVVKFYRLDTYISVSDIFVFLALLLFGREAAVVIGATESLYSSLKITKKPLTMAFNASAMACSTFLTAQAVYLLLDRLPQAGQAFYSSNLIMAACVMGAVQYVLNSWTVAIAAALWAGKPVIATWRKHYVWTSITYLAGASAAAITYRLIDVVGFYACIAVMPIVGIIYFTYLTHIKNVASVTAQAESEKRFHQAFNEAPIGMALVSAAGKWLQ